MSIPHIPAWKRLGLKLKHANDNSELQDATSKSVPKDNKRKGEWVVNGSSDQNRQLKKPKREADASKSKLGTDEHSLRTPESNGTKLKKSVSFTTDTKVEDGDSTQATQLDRPDRLPTKPLEQTLSNRPADIVQTGGSITTKTTMKAKPKRLRSKADHKPRSTPRKATAALEYLQQYRNNRPAWKFNKNHETWLFKNILSPESIAPSYNYYLAYYLARLQSKSARQRLTEQGRAAILMQADQRSYVNDEQDREKRRLFNILDTARSELDWAESQWLEDADRAALILWSLDESPQEPRTDDKMGAKSAVRSKKNKSRTSRIDIDVSSSSESEDDTSGTDSDDQRKKHERKSTISKQAVSSNDGMDNGQMISAEGSTTSTADSDSTSTSGSDGE